MRRWAVAVGDVEQPRVVAQCGVGRSLTPLMEQLARQVLVAGGPWAVGSVRADLGRGPDAAAIGWALRGRQEVAGVLVGLDADPAPRLPDVDAAGGRLDADVFGPAGLALETTLRLLRLQDLAAIDDLTGLYNARYLHGAIDREISRLARTQAPMSLVFMDLDAFKRVNDRHGHLMGSRALVEFAALLRVGTRATDTVARYGGDEFVLVLPDTDRDQARAVARRIRERVAGETFLASTGLAARLTVSVGLATLMQPTGTAADLIRAADEAMYWVKRHGRNGIRAVRIGRAAPQGSGNT